MDLAIHDGMFIRRTRLQFALPMRKSLMNLDLQFGFGMMEHSRALIQQWKGGRVILSPRDLTSEQLERLSATITALPGGDVWLDPQFYVPRADHERLCSHDYWPDSFTTGLFWQGAALTNLLTKLFALNRTLKTSAVVLPGMLASSIDEDWFAAQEAVISEARRLSPQAHLVATIALSDDALTDIAQISELLERVETWDVWGFYIVAQHPNGSYLVADPIWLANLIDLAAGLKLLGRFVTIGYTTHQILIAALAKVDRLGSGTWMNVRSFAPDKFTIPVEEEIRQRTKWYYCPQALSEYKIPFLDVAYRVGVLDSMKAPNFLGSKFADALFAGVQPSSVKAFTEQAAFRHYLQCFRQQAADAVKPTFSATYDEYMRTLDRAEQMLGSLRSKGIYGQLREFTDALEANRSAAQTLSALRSAVLERRWATL